MPVLDLVLDVRTLLRRESSNYDLCGSLDEPAETGLLSGKQIAIGSFMKFSKSLNKAIFISLTAVYLTSVGYPAPAYIVCAISIIFILAKHSEIRLKNRDVAFFGLLSTFIILIVARTDNFSTTNLAFMVNLVCSLIIFTYMLSLSKKTNWWQLSKIIFTFVIILAVWDTYYKITHPLELSIEALEGRDFYDIGFYEYKNSFLYKDSNGLAFMLMPVCVLGIALHSKIKNQHTRLLQKLFYLNLFMVLPFALLLLTFSRAGTIVGLLIIFIHIFGLKLSALLSSVGVLYFIPTLYSYISADLSGGTKLNELYGLQEFLRNSDILQLLIGTGFGEGEIWTQRFIHGALHKIVIELGLIGLPLFYGSCIMLCRNKYSTVSIVAICIFSLSSNFYFLPPFAVCIVYLLTKLESENPIQLERKRTASPLIVQYQ